MSDSGMSDSGASDVGMSDSGASDSGPASSGESDTGLSDAGLRLVLDVPSPSGLDEVLVGRVSLTNETTEPVSVNGRLTLAEGDLGVTATGAGGVLEAGWPWPADSGLRTLELAPGAALETGVLLLSTPTSQPLFPAAGRYTLVATYDVGGGGRGPVVTSEPVSVTRTEPRTDAARADRRALQDRDVIQSVAAGGTMGTAGPSLADLAEHATGPTALLARLAGGSAPASGDEAGSEDPVAAAAALTAVLLPGDERREALGAALDLGRDARARAMLRAEPTP